MDLSCSLLWAVYYSLDSRLQTTAFKVTNHAITESKFNALLNKQCTHTHTHTDKCRYMSVLHGLVQLIHVHQLKRSCGEVCLPSVTMATTLTHQSMTINSTTTHTHHNNTPSTAWSRDYPYPPPHSISSWKRGRRRIFRSEIVQAWDHRLEIRVRVHCHTWHMRLWMLKNHCFF